MHDQFGIFNLAAPSLTGATIPSASPSPSISPNSTGGSATNSLSSASSFCREGGSFCINAIRNLTDNTVSITVQSSYKGWASFGIGTSMANSKIFVGWLNSKGQPIISQRKGASYVQPPLSQTQEFQFIANPSTVSILSTSNIVYSLQIPASMIGTTGPTAFVYALAQSGPSDPNSASSSFNQHSATGSFTLDVSKAGSSIGTDTARSPNFVLYHGLCMFFAWCICPSAAIFIARYLKTRLGHLWYKLHVGIMFGGVALLMALGLLFIELSLPDGVASFSGRTVHGVIGMVIAFGLYPVQIVLGYVANALFSTERKEIPWWDKLHWWVGRIAVLLGLANICLGLLLWNAGAAYIAVYWSIVAMILGVFVWMEFKGGAVHHVQMNDA
ncbi:hypothetical protein BDR26DRAFT_804719 [Obelidium mucronatum]|nr:hypothetical protein BDR26DRAFT_804719 [Obelidium mucronatum]